MNAFVIDAFEFCRLNERREGEIAVADLPRLAEESVGKSGSVRWSLQGGSDRRGNPQLTLSITGGVQLMCQRCLATPFAFDIVSESVLVLAQDEASADEMEELLVDEPVEVIVGSRTFDIANLVEDEALLAIPQSPRHEVCPTQLPAASKDAEKVSPFAVLKSLKK